MKTKTRRRIWRRMKEEQQQAYTLDHIMEYHDKIAASCERNSWRDERKSPIRAVMYRYCFLRHEAYLDDLSMFSQLGLWEKGRKIKSYKNWKL